MTTSKNPLRGEVYRTELDPTSGAEMRKTRPCLVITTNIVNQRRRTVVIIPLSTTAPKSFPLYVPLRSISLHCQAVIDQIRVVDKTRLLGRVGVASEEDLETVGEAIKVVFELSG